MSSEARSERIAGPVPIGRPGPSWRGDPVRTAEETAAAGSADAPATFTPCSLRRRLAGVAIDQALVWGVMLVLASIALGVAGVEEEPAPGTREASIFQAIGLVSLVAPFLYFWAWNSAGFSPGKRLLRLRVVDEHGLRPGVMRGFARTVASLLVPLSLGIAYASLAWDVGVRRPLAEGHRQAWHDRLSGTFVVRT